MTADDLARDQTVLNWARQILRTHGHGLSAACTPACLPRAGAMPPDAMRADAPPAGRPVRTPVAERVAGQLMCPACLLPRIVPGHRLRGCR